MLILNLELLEQAADEFIDYLNANTPNLNFCLFLVIQTIKNIHVRILVFLSEREVAVFR